MKKSLKIVLSLVVFAMLMTTVAFAKQDEEMLVNLQSKIKEKDYSDIKLKIKKIDEKGVKFDREKMIKKMDQNVK